MKRFSKCFHRGEKGFTLIELLVVVAILGVIAAIAIPSVARFIGRGDEEAARTERDNVQLAVVAAMADEDPVCGELSAACTVTPTGGSDCACNGSGALAIDEYIVGGYESLTYEYSVGLDGVVAATTGPASG